MGNVGSSGTKRFILSNIARDKNIHFTTDEILHLEGIFLKHSAKSDNDHLLAKKDFKIALQDANINKNALELFDKLFEVFNVDGTALNFKEFILGLSILLKGTIEEKFQLAFRIFDKDKTGLISEDELYQMFDCLDRAASGDKRERKDISEDLREKVKKIFEDCDKSKNGKLDSNEFLQAAIRHPILVKFVGLTIKEQGKEEGKGAKEEKDSYEEKKDKIESQLKEMDYMGFGTMEHVDQSAKPEAMYAATVHALSIGYRTLDTAELYSTTAHVGKAIKDSSIPREELFIISKLKGLPSEDYADVLRRVKKLLTDLNIEYLDVLLIHWPGPADIDWNSAPDEFIKNIGLDFFKKNIEKAWINMLQLRKDGLTRQVGVSNFYQTHLDELFKYVKEDSDRPVVNQIYIDLVHQELEFVSKMQEQHIKVIACRPIAFMNVVGLVKSMVPDFGDGLDKALKSLGAADDIQLVLAMLMKRGIYVIPKSKNTDHIDSNFKACDLLNSDKLLPTLLAEYDNDKNKTVDMYGGVDEYAVAFKTVADAKE